MLFADDNDINERVQVVHVLTITYFKAGTGFVAKCSCGERICRPTGCNRPGMDYARGAAWEHYQKHCRKVGASPVMHPDCDGLAGVSLT